MNRNLTISAGVVIAAAAALAVALTVDRSSSSSAAATPGENAITEDTHLLDVGDDDAVTVVEFLDFECEACLAAYPMVEQVRQDYDGLITFGVRYFPIASHPNAELAARAVESAARQDAFEGMYQRMYQTQEQWGHQDASQQDTFVGFAEDLGLDVDQFVADLDDPDVADRVAADQQAGLDMGVQGTPTFFVDGEQVDIGSYQDLTDAIDTAMRQ